MHLLQRLSWFDSSCPSSLPSPAGESRGVAWRRPLGLAAGVVFLSIALSACVTAIPVTPAANAVPVTPDERISDIAQYTLPTPAPEIVPDVTAVVVTEGSRANVRSGPNIDSPIVLKANPGDTFKVTGKSADGEWWQICCVRGPADAAGEATELAWLATVVVELDGNADAVPVIEPILPDDLQATWKVDYSCGSERCTVKECQADILAKTAAGATQQWLQVDSALTWADGCFDDDSWSLEVDRYSGRERDGATSFIFDFWLGEQEGAPTNVYTLDSGRKVAVYCTDPQEFEDIYQDGWTALHSGTACYDMRTGTAVWVNYSTRFLFTGQYEGQRYERAYFGDYETTTRYLVDTNADLDYFD